jgi:hypothetical protein
MTCYNVTVSNTTIYAPVNPTRRKLTPEQEARIVQLMSTGAKREVLAVQFGVHPNTILNVFTRGTTKKEAQAGATVNPGPSTPTEAGVSDELPTNIPASTTERGGSDA